MWIQIMFRLTVCDLRLRCNYGAPIWRALIVGMLLVVVIPLLLLQPVFAMTLDANPNVDLALKGQPSHGSSLDLWSEDQPYLGCHSEQLFVVIDGENRRLAGSHVFSDQWITKVGQSCLKLVLRAAGRIGSDRLLPFIQKHGLSSMDPKARLIAERALGLFSSQEARKLALQSLNADSDNQPSPALMFSLGRLGGKEDLALFESVLAKMPSHNRGEVYLGLGHLLLKGDATWTLGAEALGIAIEDSISPIQKTSLSASFALARYRGVLPTGELNQRLFEKTESSLRFWFGQLNGQANNAQDRLAYLARFCVQFRSAETNDKLIGYLNENFLSNEHPRLQVVGLRLLSLFKGRDFAFDSVWKRLQVLTAMSRGSAPDPMQDQILVQIFETIGLLQPTIRGHGSVSERRIRLLEEWQTRGSPWVKKGAFELHAQISSESIGDLITRVYETPHSVMWKKSVELSLLAKSEDFLSGLSVILDRLGDENRSVVSVALGSLDKLDIGLISLEIRSQLIDRLRLVLSRNDEVFLGAVSELALKLELWDLQLEVFAALQEVRESTESSSLVSALKFIGRAGKPVDREQLAWFVSHPDRAVGMAAAETVKVLFNEDLLTYVRESSLIRASTPSVFEINEALNSRLVFGTSKGFFSVEPGLSSPLTVTNFVALAKRGFYNNLPFHRVVPNFVAQGGDPRGDGSGGPGYSIREEASLDWGNHLRGQLGMATSGKDTGGSQFFVNHGANLHLIGTYTSFGQVTSGMDVVDALTQDDVVLSVTVLK